MFFAGRYSLTTRLLAMRDEAVKSREMAELAEARSRILAQKAQSTLQSFASPVVTNILGSCDVKAQIDGLEVLVRIPGIVVLDVSHPVSEQAEKFVSDFCLQKSVRILGSETDRYGRRLADILVDGESLRESMLKAGLAQLKEDAKGLINRLSGALSK